MCIYIFNSGTLLMLGAGLSKTMFADMLADL